VTIEGNRVSISAKIKHEKEAKEGERVTRSERSDGMAYIAYSSAFAQENLSKVRGELLYAACGALRVRRFYTLSIS